MYYSSLKSMAQVQYDLTANADDHCHLSIARDIKRSIAYCQKEEGRIGGPYVFGDPPQQGKRTDLILVKQAVDKGASVPQLWEDHFSNMIRYHRGVTLYTQVKRNYTKRTWKTKVLLFVGPAGMQKSTLANVLAPYFGSSVYSVPESKASGIYFDGYIGQDVVILDEMDGKRMQPTMFNLIADQFSASVPQCGNPDVNWAPRVLIVISNYLPKYWWRKRSAEQIKQTTRRIDWIVSRFRPIIPTTPTSNSHIPLKAMFAVEPKRKVTWLPIQHQAARFCHPNPDYAAGLPVTHVPPKDKDEL